jgi:hypothetical protein
LRTLGPLVMTAVARDDIERLVESMDRTIALPEDDEDRVSWKTMSNARVLVSKMFKDSAGAKQRDPRVRTTDPRRGSRRPSTASASRRSTCTRASSCAS